MLFWIFFILIGAQAAAWSLATPLLAGPDEPSHIITAAADVRGHFAKAHEPGQAEAMQQVHLPAMYSHLQSESLCLELSFGPADCSLPQQQCRELTQTSQSCGLPVRSGGPAATATTYTGRYPPFYFLLVGIPTLFGASPTVLYLMRLLGVLLGTLLIALGFFSVARWSSKPLLIAGTSLALTPASLYLIAVINPNGLEVASAVCLWTAGAVLLCERRSAIPSGLLAIVGVSAITLLVSRPVSPLWTVMILAILLLMADRGTLRMLWQGRVVRYWMGAIGLVTVVAAAWIFIMNATLVLPAISRPPLGTPWLTIARTTAGQWSVLLQQMIGVMGWDNASAPLATFLLWYAGVGFVAVLAFSAASRTAWRKQVALGLTIGLTALVPVVYSVATARSVGYLISGRYTLALAVGITIVAATIVDRGSLDVVRLVRVLTAMVAVGQFSAFCWVLRRYTVGASGSLNPLKSVPGGWRPPVPVVLLIVFFAIVTLATVIWSCRVASEMLFQSPDVQSVRPPPDLR